MKKEVKVGQIWKDRDRRMPDRYMLVIDIKAFHAIMQPCTPEGAHHILPARSIMLERMSRQCGWLLVKEL